MSRDRRQATSSSWDNISVAITVGYSKLKKWQDDGSVKSNQMADFLKKRNGSCKDIYKKQVPRT